MERRYQSPRINAHYRGWRDVLTELRRPFASFSITSVLRHARIDVLGPRRDPAFQVDQTTVEARAFERLDRFRAAHATLAMHDRVELLIDLVHARDDVAQRDQLRSRNARNLELVRLAHVDDLNLVATQTTRVQLRRTDLFEF